MSVSASSEIWLASWPASQLLCGNTVLNTSCKNCRMLYLTTMNPTTQHRPNQTKSSGNQAKSSRNQAEAEIQAGNPSRKASRKPKEQAEAQAKPRRVAEARSPRAGASASWRRQPLPRRGP